MHLLFALLLAGDAGVAPESFGARLATTIGAGQAVAILPTADGLLAIAADGARRKQLVAGKIDWAMVDDRAQVIWFGRAKALWIIDLLGTSGAAEDIARYNGDEPVSICYGEDRGQLLGLLASVYDAHLVLNMVGTPQLAYESGIYDDIMEEQGLQNRRRLAHIRWSKRGRERVAALATRGQGRTLFLPSPEAESRVKSVPAASCEAKELCGSARRLGDTRFLAVIVAHGCGDACHVRSLLYDSTSQQFFDAAKPSRRSRQVLPGEGVTGVADAFIPASGEGFVSNGALYHFQRGLVAETRAAAQGGGWLGHSWYVD
jgi:hypothetical protein